MRSSVSRNTIVRRAALVFLAAAQSVNAEPVGRFPDVGGAPRKEPEPNASVAPAPRVEEPPIVRRAPSGSQALLERGARHEKAGRLAEAAAAYTEAVRLDTSNGQAVLALGRLRVRMNDLGEAEALLSAATNFSDVAAQAFAERARLRKARGREDDASRDLANAVALAPEETAWSEELARWYVTRRAWLPALSIYRRLALELRGSPRQNETTLQVRALRLLSGGLDPVVRGGTADYSFTRRALARLDGK